jgi:hypothetical protein
MNPSEFRVRYINLLPSIPLGLDLDIGEFVYYPTEKIAKLNILQADKDLLEKSGLPSNAAPFLSFNLRSDIMLEVLMESPHCKMLGHTGYGDIICIDESDRGSIVCFNHDREMARVFVNSSIRSLAYSLCSYLEFKRTHNINACRMSIGEYDRQAMEENSFWAIETSYL